MIAVSLRLLAGQYHATPWGRHVNEGEVEWPPSPWRLLRALLATWHRKAADEIPETVMRALVARLAERLPEYHLPAASLAHTRHYMPLYNSARDDKTARVFDTFACVDRSAAACVVWPDAAPPPTERDALQVLLSRLGYLGRAESWIEASLTLAPPTGHFVCRPVDGEVDPESDAIRLLAPMTDASYNAWLDAMGSAGNGKARKSKVVRPVDTWHALHAETGDLRAAGWSDPPGSRWVLYGRPRAAYDVRLPAVKSGRAPAQLPRVARFAVAGAVPPLFVNGISFAEKVHRVLVLESCKIAGDDNGMPVFTGMEGGIKRSGHDHVHILFEANDSRRRGITHVTLFARDGFDAEARLVLERMWQVYGRETVQLVLLGLGQPEDFAGPKLSAGQCPLFCKSRVWLSRTPFVPTRHPKFGAQKIPKVDEHGLPVGSPAHDLLRLLEAQGLPRPEVSSLDHTSLGNRPARWLDFRTTRHQGGGLKASNRGFGFRLEFESPVEGPIVAGYGAHFGLGTFWPREVLEHDASASLEQHALAARHG